MSEKNIERIEKKVDLLYKILLELNVDYVGHPYDQEYINRFMSELVPLFGLSGVETDIEITQKETIKELENNLKTELSRLKKIYESGDFLAKDEDKIKNKMGDITSYLQEWDVVVDEWILAGKEDLINKSKDLYKKGLFLDLKKKLGLLDKSSMINGLIREVNDSKKSLNNTIEKIRNLGKANN